MIIGNYIKHLLLLTVTLPMMALGLVAQPDLNNKINIDGTIIYQDAVNPQVYYYAPGKLNQVTGENGKPAFKFLQMRYTGTKATVDQGAQRFNSIIKIKVSFESPTIGKMEEITRKLATNNEVVRLKALPLQKIEAMLVYATIGEAESDNNVLTGGFFGNETEDQSAIWQERIYTLRLDKYSAQAFQQAFEGGKSLLSFDYAYYANGIYKDDQSISVEGDPVLVREMRERFSSLDDSSNQKVDSKMILADAFQILIDPDRYPDLIEKVDINQLIPPDYAAVDVYCYDFHNKLRDDLHAKKIEFKAVGVGRHEVISKVIFRERSQDIYAQHIRFKHSVKMEQPLQYRITEVKKDGDIRVSDWIIKENWSQIVDVTSTKPN
ncbi:hypothetical protein QQ020_33225 [Fulvivirgaceae bacterium BMA12]|uniref:Uncharacterized protein n=1 Tax=Agaribacillus aureus TaxID=3051825 RepID=A0ABT8LJT1_9BACT|nr:hypothetical protein [Fulvivirgaceae bacterium BMA12]